MRHPFSGQDEVARAYRLSAMMTSARTFKKTSQVHTFYGRGESRLTDVLKARLCGLIKRYYRKAA